ncbi:phosphatase PAP2 family protein [Cellulomonas gelida]|uniref:phosphatase PAP2 family protein n=1 Tax=Cellulomonas gelida TaxID=1712 RepID=UPI00166CA49E|nr:phosphatase PAP2 family protein [Cellulomonas gelida]GGL36330.1 hypothetical protein GCM10009774_28650 [Cellulomonas gelida]
MGGEMAVERSTSGGARRTRGEIIREVVLVVGLYVAYSATRLAASGSWDVAKSHARGILDVERWLRIDIEHALNTATAQHTWLEVATSYWYQSMHYLVTPTVLVVLFFRRPLLYRPARTALLGATFLALFGYFFFPTAPPRLLGQYVDTVSESSVYGRWPSAAEQAASGAGSVTNQVAAMPSMHVGWAVWVSVVLAYLLRRRWAKVAVWGYAATTTAIVVLTGNHWVLDAVAGAALVLGCWWFAGHRYGLWAPRAQVDAELDDLVGEVVPDTRRLAATNDDGLALASTVDSPPPSDPEVEAPRA